MNTSNDILLYPLIFEPILKDKIWGGEKLKNILNKETGDSKSCGESWELSDVDDDISIIKNGSFKGTTLREIITQFPKEILGESVINKSGHEFPLLVKFIDANEDLSIQVHPGDELAKKRHNCLGKTEMWYLVEADPGTTLISGFSKKTSKEEYLKQLQNNTLDSILNKEQVERGDTFHIPAGRVHTIGKGCLIAEIQQTSDVTYRIYDFDRKDEDGNQRELHTELALDAIDYNFYNNYKTVYKEYENKKSNLVTDRYFCTNKLIIDKQHTLEYNDLDSFVIYTCVEGKLSIKTNNYSIDISKGQVILIPACIKKINLTPISPSATILETYIP